MSSRKFKSSRHDYDRAERLAAQAESSAELAPEEELRALDEAAMDDENPDAGVPLSMLPEGAWVVGFKELAERLAASPKGLALLTGIERGAAGLERFVEVSYDHEVGRAFSFCVDGATYTAFENPDDGYRSSMGSMVAREGNWCETQFEPCALIATFANERDLGWANSTEDSFGPSDERAAHSDILRLHEPSGMEVALAVGTRRSDEYYPCFVGHHCPKTLQKARDLGLALAGELDDTLPSGIQAPRRGRI